MRTIAFVIAALPRSGTRYTSRLFRTAGVWTGHEKYFKVDRQLYFDDRDDAFGDVSWLSVPFLGQLPDDTVVLHQKRDRDKAVKSMHYRCNKDGVPGLLQIRSRYARFIKTHCPQAFECDSYEEGLYAFYDFWTKEIEKHAVFSYDVEELQDPVFTQGLIKKASGVELPLEQVEYALTRVSTTDHTNY